MQASLVTASSRFPFSAWFSFLIRDQVTMTTRHSGSPFSFALYIILKIKLLSVWHLLPFLTNFFSLILHRSSWKKPAASEDLLSPDMTSPISSGVNFAFSEAQIPSIASPQTHFKLNYSSIIQLLKTRKTVMVHQDLFWFKTHAVQVLVAQNGSSCY